MRQHAPKIAALEAYAHDQLSLEGRARVERHLTACAECTRALVAIQTYDRVRESVRETAPPELAWESLERALDRPPARPASRTGRIVAVAWPVLAVAATLVIAWVGLSGRVEPSLPTARTTNPPLSRPPVEEALAEGWVTLASASAELERAGVRSQALPGASVQEGMLLRTGPGAELHVALGGETGVIVGPDSEVRVTRLRERSTRFDLVRGDLFNRVKKLGGDESYHVGVDAYVAQVRGTRFRVAQRGAPEVSVHEGRVAILEGDRELALLTAGQHWAAAGPGAQATTTDGAGTTGPDRVVHGLELDSRAWPTLTLPAHAGVAAWEIDQARLGAAGVLAMRAPVGNLTLRFEDLTGRMHSVTVAVAAEGSTLDEALIASLLAPRPEPVGYLAPEQVAPVVRGGLDALRRCYERSLRRVPSLGARVVLSVRVAADGRAARAELRGEDAVPEELQRCIVSEARTWRFPRPQGGGSVALEVPLNLKSKH